MARKGDGSVGGPAPPLLLSSLDGARRLRTEAHSACCPGQRLLPGQTEEQTLGALGLGLGEVGSQPQATCMLLPLLASPELSHPLGAIPGPHPLV